MHIDKAFAAPHGGLTAPGIYLFAIKMRLVHSLPLRRTVLATFGYDEVRFHQSAHPGDALTLELKWTEKRRSRSKPDLGIVSGRYSLINAAGEVVMSLPRYRADAAAQSGAQRLNGGGYGRSTRVAIAK